MTTSLQPCQPLIQLRLTRCQAQDHNDTVTTDKMPSARSQCKPAMISEIGKWMVEASSYAKIIPGQQQMALYRRAAVPLDSSTAAGWAPLTTNLTPHLRRTCYKRQRDLCSLSSTTIAVLSGLPCKPRRASRLLQHEPTYAPTARLRQHNGNKTSCQVE